MEPPQNPFDPPEAAIQVDERRPVALAAVLWVVFFLAVIVDGVYIHHTRSLFESMYEGLGSYLPGTTRFFLNPASHAVAFLAVPLMSVAAGVAWRLKAKAGLVLLMLSVILATGWGLTYRWAMKQPIDSLEQVLDSTHE